MPEYQPTDPPPMWLVTTENGKPFIVAYVPDVDPSVFIATSHVKKTKLPVLVYRDKRVP